MNPWWLVSYVGLWLVVLLLGFLLLGALRALGLLRWRLEQVEATTPSKVGRSGLKPGKKAPDFSLPCTAGGEVSLHDFAGRRVFLVFTQSGCKPCHRIVPELNTLQRGGTAQVLVVNNGTMEATRQWAEETSAGFPVLVQQQFAVSKRYETYATP
ncbi:MAG TPA: redoxin domain-containing protein, partial [Gemmataceae bacterium]|nr:redoxin domain-containing protein [Gemmataceae bacterium]